MDRDFSNYGFDHGPIRTSGTYRAFYMLKVNEFFKLKKITPSTVLGTWGFDR